MGREAALEHAGVVTVCRHKRFMGHCLQCLAEENRVMRDLLEQLDTGRIQHPQRAIRTVLNNLRDQEATTTQGDNHS